MQRSISLVFVLSLFVLSACTKAQPTLEELKSMLAPKFNGQENWEYIVNTPSSAVSFDGECDARVSLLEVSFDNLTWIDVATLASSNVNCSTTGTFHFEVADISVYFPGLTIGDSKDVYLKASSAGGVTGQSKFKVKYEVASPTPSPSPTPTASPTPPDFLDNDNSSMGFGGGTYGPFLEWNGIDAVRLNASGITNGTGTFLSRIIDSGSASSSWGRLVWIPKEPYGKPLPNYKQSESGYPSGASTMTNNTLLMHFDESSYSGIANEIKDFSSNNFHGTMNAPVDSATNAVFGRSLNLTSGTSSVMVNSSTALSPTGAFSIEFWFKPEININSSYNKTTALIDKGQYSIEVNHEGNIQFNKLASGADTILYARDVATASTYIKTTAITRFRNGIYASVEAASNAKEEVFACKDNNFDGLCDAAFTFVYNNTGAKSATAMVVFNDVLYVGFGEGTSDGNISYCSVVTGGTYADLCDSTEFVASSAFTNQFAVRSFAIVNNKLYAAMEPDGGSGEKIALKVCNPSGGSLPNICEASDWTDAFDWSWTSLGGEAYTGIYSTAVIDNILYVGMGGATGQADVYMCDSSIDGVCDEESEWVNVYNDASTYDQVTSMIEYGGSLYFGLQQASDGILLVCNSASAAPFQICDSGDSQAAAFNLATGIDSVESMSVFGNRLYVGTGWNTGDAKLYSCGMSNAGSNNLLCETIEWVEKTLPDANDIVSSISVINNKLYFGTGGANYADILYFNDSSKTVRSVTSSFDSSKWYHIAAVFDGITSMKIYINGVLDNSITVSGSPVMNSDYLFIGKRIGSATDMGAATTFTEGYIDELAMFNSALSATEVGSHYRRGGMRVRFQIMSCNDSACSGESWSTDYTELSNYSLNTPSLMLPGIALNQYFRYQMTLESDTGTTPEVRAVEVVPGAICGAGMTLAQHHGGMIMCQSAAPMMYSSALSSMCDASSHLCSLSEYKLGRSATPTFPAWLSNIGLGIISSGQYSHSINSGSTWSDYSNGSDVPISSNSNLNVCASEANLRVFQSEYCASNSQFSTLQYGLCCPN